MLIARKLFVLVILLLQISFGQDSKVFLPFGHAIMVGSFSFSPDGSLFASCAESEGCILIWDVKTGREVVVLRAQNADHITFSPDGQFLASGGDAGIQLWNVATGEETRLQNEHGWIYSIAFSPDSKYIASSADFPGQSYLDKVQIRSVASGQIVSSFSGKVKFACSMAFNPAEPVLAISSCYTDLNIIELWNPMTGKFIKTLTERGDRLKFSGDGKILMARNNNDGLYVFKMPEGRLIHTEASIGYPAGFSKTGEVVAYGVMSKTATFFNLEEKKKTRTLYLGSPWVISYDSCKNVFAHIDTSGKMVLRNADNLDVLYTFGETNGKLNSPKGMMINSVDSCLAIRTEDSTYRVWSALSNRLQKVDKLRGKWMSTNKDLSPKQRKIIDEMEEDVSIEFSCASPDGTLFAFSLGGDICLFDSVRVVRRFPTSGFNPRASFSTDSKKLIVMNKGGMTIYDIFGDKELGSFVSLRDTDWVFVTPDGLYDGTARGIKFPHWVEKNQPIPLENSKKSKYVPGLLKQILYGN